MLILFILIAFHESREVFPSLVHQSKGRCLQVKAWWSKGIQGKADVLIRKGTLRVVSEKARTDM